MHSHIIPKRELDYQNQYVSVDTAEYTISYLVFESPVFKIKHEINYYSFNKVYCCNSDWVWLHLIISVLCPEI